MNERLRPSWLRPSPLSGGRRSPLLLGALPSLPQLVGTLLETGLRLALGPRGPVLEDVQLRLHLLLVSVVGSLRARLEPLQPRISRVDALLQPGLRLAGGLGRLCLQLGDLLLHRGLLGGDLRVDDLRAR